MLLRSAARCPGKAPLWCFLRLSVPVCVQTLAPHWTNQSLCGALAVQDPRARPHRVARHRVRLQQD